jgi:hypothetical protein
MMDHPLLKNFLKAPFVYTPEGVTFVGGYGYNYHCCRYSDIDIMAGLYKPRCGGPPINLRVDHKIADKLLEYNLCSECAKLDPPRISLFEGKEEYEKRINKIKNSEK